MINVGQGDSFFLTLDNSDGTPFYILIDSGTSDKSGAVINHLLQFGPADRSIDLMIATHLDGDHIGGFEAVLDYFHPELFVINTPGNLADWIALRKSLTPLGTPQSIRAMVEDVALASRLVSKLESIPRRIIPAYSGQYLDVGNTRLRILNPTPERVAAAWADTVLKEIEGDYTVKGFLRKPPGHATIPAIIAGALLEGKTRNWQEASNNSSIVFDICPGRIPYALFTGDATKETLKEVAAQSPYTLVKIPHHGSKSGVDEELISRWKLRAALIPVGENPHGHPDLDVLKLLHKHGAKTWCSERTKDCRKSCRQAWGPFLRFRHQKPLSPGLIEVDGLVCSNNDPTLRE